MSDPEQRNDDGYPFMSGPVTRPRGGLRMAPGSAIGGNLQLGHTTDNSINKPLPWVAVASLFGGLGFGGMIAVSLWGPLYVQSEVRASNAELRAEFSQRIARVEALAELSRKEASTAKDMTDLEIQRRKAREELKR